MSELENKVVGAFLEYPKQLGLKRVEREWFYDATNQQIMSVLVENPNFTDLSELMKQIKDRFPSTEITEKHLHYLTYDSSKVDSLKGALKTLEEIYVQNHIDQAMENYQNSKTQKNREAMENWFRIYNELGIEEDSGDTKPAINELLDEMENGVKPGIKTFPSFDMTLGNGMEGAMMIVVGARPGVGKTAFAINLIVEALQKQTNLAADIFTLEMTKMQMLKRFVARLTRLNSYKLKNTKNLSKEQKKDVIDKAEFIYQSGLRIHDKRFKISEIERMIRQRKHELPDDTPYFAVIDYLTLIDAENEQAPRRLQIGKITRTIKLLTNELDIPIVVLSQLSRNKDGRAGNKPTLQDLRESGDIEQDANVVGFLYNVYDEDENPDQHTETPKVMFDVAKNREGDTLPLKFRFHKPEMRFEEGHE